MQWVLKQIQPELSTDFAAAVFGNNWLLHAIVPTQWKRKKTRLLNNSRELNLILWSRRAARDLEFYATSNLLLLVRVL